MIKNKITIGDQWVMIVDSSPITGLVAPIGSIAILNAGSDMWKKSGALSTDWTKIAKELKTTTVTGSSTTLPTGVDTKVEFTAFGLNDGGVTYSSGDFTIVESGRYRISVQISYSDAAPGNVLRQLAIRVGGINHRLHRSDRSNGGTSALNSYSLELVTDIAASTIVNFFAIQNSGGSAVVVNNELTYAHFERIR